MPSSRRFDNCKMEMPVWRRCYRQSYLQENNLRFADHVYFEDTDFGILSLALTPEIIQADFPFYGYRKNPQSILSVKKRKLFLDDISAVKRTVDKLRQRDGIEEQTRRHILKLLKRIICNYIRYSREFRLLDSMKAVLYLRSTGLLDIEWPERTKTERVRLALLKYAPLLTVSLRKLLMLVIKK